MEKKSFEEKLQDLENIVKQLEEENNGLEESVKLYEKARSLSKELTDELEESEKKVALLMEEDGSKIPFHPIEEEK